MIEEANKNVFIKFLFGVLDIFLGAVQLDADGGALTQVRKNDTRRMSRNIRIYTVYLYAVFLNICHNICTDTGKKKWT